MSTDAAACSSTSHLSIRVSDLVPLVQHSHAPAHRQQQVTLQPQLLIGGQHKGIALMRQGSIKQTCRHSAAASQHYDDRWSAFASYSCTCPVSNLANKLPRLDGQHLHFDNRTAQSALQAIHQNEVLAMLSESATCLLCRGGCCLVETCRSHGRGSLVAEGTCRKHEAQPANKCMQASLVGLENPTRQRHTCERMDTSTSTDANLDVPCQQTCNKHAARVNAHVFTDI